MLLLLLGFLFFPNLWELANIVHTFYNNSHMYMYVWVCMCVYVCMYIYVYMYMCVCICIYIEDYGCKSRSIGCVADMMSTEYLGSIGKL